MNQKLVHLVQGHEGEYAEAEAFRELIHTAYTLPALKITVSENLSKRLLKHYPDHRFLSCGQGLERNYFYPAKTDHGSNNYSKSPDERYKYDTVFLVGSLDISIKRIKTGLAAYKIAARRFPGLGLVRISTSDTRKIEEKITGPMDGFHCSLPPKAVGKLFRSRKGILLSPSSQGEGFGLPPLEAMACCVPVVLTDIESYRNFSTARKYAVFVPVDDAETMANALVELVTNTVKRGDLINNGLEVAKKYSYKRVAKKLEKIFCKWITPM